MGRDCTDPGQKLGQILGRPGTEAGQSLLTLARSWGGLGEIVEGEGDCGQFGQVLGRCWPDDVQILGRRWADAEEIFGGSWAGAWADTGQILGRSWGRPWADLGEMLESSWGDLVKCWASASNLSALPVPCQDRFFVEVFWVLVSLRFLARF